MREFYISTEDWAIVKWRYVERAMGWKAEVFHARPGSTMKEAWENAIDVAKITKKEFIAAGWTAQRLIIMGYTR